MLPLLEQSAMRLGGFATKADLIKAKQRPGSEFRFEAMSHPGWMGKARHLSFHGTGRAMDFGPARTPAFGGPTHQLVSILGEGELSELEAGSTQQRQDLQRVATHNADVLRLRGELQARLAAATDDVEKARLRGDIERIDAHLRDSVQTDRTTVGVRGRATRTHQQVKEIEAKFLAAWATISLMREFPLGEDLAATLIGDKVDAAADAAKQALDDAVKAKSPDVGKLRPAWPGSRKSAPCSTTRRRRSTTPIRGRCSRRSRSSRIGHHRHAVLDGGGIRGAGLAVGDVERLRRRHALRLHGPGRRRAERGAVPLSLRRGTT